MSKAKDMFSCFCRIFVSVGPLPISEIYLQYICPQEEYPSIHWALHSARIVCQDFLIKVVSPPAQYHECEKENGKTNLQPNQPNPSTHLSCRSYTAALGTNTARNYPCSHHRFPSRTSVGLPGATNSLGTRDYQPGL